MTPTAHPALTDMIAVSSKSKVKPLGYITWFSVPDQPVPLPKLKLAMVRAFTTDAKKMLPPEPRPVDVFKRAMRAQEGKVTHPDGTITQTDIKQVVEDSDYCIYQISRVTRDNAKRLVNYPKAMRVVFDKAPAKLNDPSGVGPLDFTPLSETPLEDVFPMQEEIETYYRDKANVIDGRKVRAIVRDFIRNDTDRPDAKDGTIGLSGENLRGKGGGVYFVAAKYKDELDKLAEALADLHADGSAYLYMVPLADGASERELVRRHHVNNSVKELEEAVADMRVLFRSDRKQAIRADHAAFHWRRVQALKRRVAEYRALLRDEDETVEAALVIAEKQVQKLPDMVAA